MGSKLPEQRTSHENWMKELEGASLDWLLQSLHSKMNGDPTCDDPRFDYDGGMKPAFLDPLSKYSPHIVMQEIGFRANGMSQVQIESTLGRLTEMVGSDLLGPGYVLGLMNLSSVLTRQQVTLELTSPDQTSSSGE
ncbi:hypothetical protein HY468_03730 [Candidatus Roizmanbacteria bacterium]|nr:hypothetical protein [Candidatus Roizmanbacteria bacterium]